MATTTDTLAESRPVGLISTLAWVIAAPLREFRGHPDGLRVLFTAEMWERASFYGQRAILVLYLTKAVGMERGAALELSAAYVGLVYLTPVLGGWISDMWANRSSSTGRSPATARLMAVYAGGLTMALGHFMMAFPSLLIPALGMLILGNGFFKPCCSTLVGDLYSDGDPRKARGYTIFYMGINLGAFMAPLVCGTLGESERFGWHWGFAAAGVGMIFGLAGLLWNHRKIHVSADDRNRWCGLAGGDWLTVAATALVLLMTALIAPHVWVLLTKIWTPDSSALQAESLLLWGYRTGLVVGVWACWRLALRAFAIGAVEVPAPSQPLTRIDWSCMVVVAVLSLFSIVLWTGLEQAGGTMTLFADEKTNLEVFGVTMPASYYQSLNPLIIVLFSLPMAAFWGFLDKRFPVSSIAKQGWGLVVAGLGFAVLAIAEQRVGVHGKVSPLWLTAVYLFHTFGEMMSFPVGTALVNQISPKKYLSRMMGVWLLGSAVAGYLAGILEDRLQKLESVMTLSHLLLVSMVSAGLLLLLISPALRRMCGGRMNGAQ